MYSDGNWTVRVYLLTAPDASRWWSAHIEVVLPWVQPHGASLALPCWLLTQDLETTSEAIRRSLDRGWSLTRALQWAATDERPPWLSNEYGWRKRTTGLWRVTDGEVFLRVLHDLEAGPGATLTVAGALLADWHGNSKELWDTANAVAGTG